MSTRIVLVTGSRILGARDCPYGNDVREVLRGLLDRRDHPNGVIVSGGADGPDEWALAFAAGRGRYSRRYDIDGWVYDERALRVRQWSTPDASGPLDRNARMVDDLVRQRERGAHVEVVGLVAEWSKTKGTDHTLRLAKDAGFPCVVVRWSR